MKEKLSSVTNEDLASLLSRKIQAFEDYYMATVLLGQTLAGKNISKIEATVNLRESQIENINLIDREIQKLTSGGLINARSGNKKINELFVKLEEIVKKTQTNDNSCIGSAKVLLKETSNNLISPQKGFQGYDDEKQSRRARFLDLKT